MKRLLSTCFCSFVLAATLAAQDASPTPSVGAAVDLSSPAATSTLSITPSAAASPAASVSSSSSPLANDDSEAAFERKIEDKLKKHFRVTVNGKQHDIGRNFDEGAAMAIPIVGIIFTTLFGAPVMVVAVIMFMNYLKARSLHRTVRAMVEKGQEVPAGLFTAPPAVRRRSDMRRGIILVMVGFGLCIFLGAVNDWDSSWSFGVIPLLIGVGYLLVWKLEGPRDNSTPVA